MDRAIFPAARGSRALHALRAPSEPIPFPDLASGLAVMIGFYDGVSAMRGSYTG